MDTLAIKRFGGTNVTVVEGDVTRQQVEAVVNTANENLQHKEGVATAVVRTGGRVIQEESDTWIREHGPLTAGEAAVTTGGMLHASHIVHAVGPYHDQENSADLLGQTAQAALAAAAAHGINTIAMPAISTGRRGFPVDEAAAVMVDAIRHWLTENPETFTEVRLVGFGEDDAEQLAAALRAAG
ncbi:MAG: macro domain-containing protein [Acidimicrobiia bacterium]|nr:macro domain-containing protein [Acidimicrobiia bacterium]